VISHKTVESMVYLNLLLVDDGHGSGSRFGSVQIITDPYPIEAQKYTDPDPKHLKINILK
jgi:hypothetical protein